MGARVLGIVGWSGSGKPLLHPSDSRIVAVASGEAFEAAVAVVDLDDVAAVARLVYSRAEPLEAVLAALEGAHGPTL
jgi:hypothetical protein